MLLFISLNLPLAAIIMQKYFNLGNNPITNETLNLLWLEHAPSSVFQFTLKKFLASEIQETPSASKDLMSLVESQKCEPQAATEAAASFPAQGMLEATQVETMGKLFNHFNDFFFCKGETAGRDDQSGICLRLSMLRVAWAWPPHKIHDNVYLGEGAVIWWLRNVHVGLSQQETAWGCLLYV